MVNQAATSTAISSDHNPGTVGQTITYTATVTVNSPGFGTPTGNVSFSDGGTPISTCQALSLPGNRSAAGHLPAGLRHEREPLHHGRLQQW